MLAVVGALIAVVALNIFGSTVVAKTLNIVFIAFGAVILFEATVIYCKIMKILYKVVDNIQLKQVIAAVVSSICMFVAVCFLGYANLTFYILFPIGIAIRLIFKVHQVNRMLPFLCSDLDEEISKFNAGELDEDFEGEEGGCGCGCGGDCDCGDGCGCGGDCGCGNHDK